MIANKHQAVFETYSGGDLTNAGGADEVVVNCYKPYGLLIISVNKHGRINLEAQDGDGKTLGVIGINPDDMVGPP